MSRTTNEEELRNKLSIFAYSRRYDGLPESMARTKIDDLMQLIEAYGGSRELEGRIDELTNLWPQFTDIRLDGTNGPEDDPRALNLIDQRLTNLKETKRKGE